MTKILNYKVYKIMYKTKLICFFNFDVHLARYSVNLLRLTSTRQDAGHCNIGVKKKVFLALFLVCT